MADEKKKAKPKAVQADPTVFVVYKGTLDGVGVFTSAELAMEAITQDRDLKVERCLLRRAKRNRA